MIYCGGEQITMCKCVEVFYKKDGCGQFSEVKTRRKGPGSPHGDFVQTE